MPRTHFEALVAMYDRAPINSWFRPTLRIPEKGRAEIEMMVREDFYHAGRAIHGAVYFKALDDATFFAVQSLVTDLFVVTSSFQLYFLRPVSEGPTSCAWTNRESFETPLHRGRRALR